MFDLEEPLAGRTNWSRCDWVVRVRRMVDGEVLTLAYCTSRKSAAEWQTKLIRRYAGQQVCVSLFNRVPVSEV